MKIRLGLWSTYLLVVSLLGCKSSGVEILETKAQNIIFILADDHARNVTGAYGNDIILTPNIDQLANEGITFTKAYCNSPICSASRASLLTGKLPHATGVNLLFTPFPDEGNETIAEHLQKQGYETALFGKTHFNNGFWSPLYKDGLPKHGFDTIIDKSTYREWLKNQDMPLYSGEMQFYTPCPFPDNYSEIARWMNAKYLPHKIHDQFSMGTFFSEQAITFLERKKDNPFFLWLSFHEPHHPYYFPLEFADMYDPDSLVLPEGSSEDDRWVPRKFKGLTEEEKKGIIASYYTSVSYMDKNIGKVIHGIERLGLSESTLIVYASDNGYLLNDHKRFEKHTLWEESVRQPLIVKHPNSSLSSIEVDFTIQYIDLVPTMLSMIGRKPLQSVQGVDISDEIFDNSTTFTQSAFAEYLEDNMAMVVKGNWKYIFATGRRDLGISYATGTGPHGVTHRLYNLNQDPKETTNLAYFPKHQSKVDSLKKELLRIFINTHPDAIDCPQNLTLDGKLAWFSEPRDIGTDQMLEDRPYPVFYAD